MRFVSRKKINRLTSPRKQNGVGLRSVVMVFVLTRAVNCRFASPQWPIESPSHPGTPEPLKDRFESLVNFSRRLPVVVGYCDESRSLVVKSQEVKDESPIDWLGTGVRRFVVQRT